MGKEFAAEIKDLPSTIRWALDADVKLLRRIVEGHAGRSLLAVGSGGSSTAALFAAQLHETRFGRVSRSTTPVGLIRHDRQAESTAVLLVSAEGKNRDILAAASHVLIQEYPSFALTLTVDTPLMTDMQNGGATVVEYDAPWGKDGYLATNSLVASMILLARAYGQDLGQALKEIDDGWLERRRKYIYDSGFGGRPKQRPICVLFGRDGTTGAVDLESKMAESALGSSQIVDYRQYAHGRHLQLSDPTAAPFFVAFHTQRDTLLANATLDTFPAGVPTLRLELPGSGPIAEIASVIDAILLTDAAATGAGVDPGQPDVAELGRAMHSLNLDGYLTQAPMSAPALRRKMAGQALPDDKRDRFIAAGLRFCETLEAARFRALACDFDGTFCNTDLRFDGLDRRVVAELERIASAGVLIGFASGRGNSLHEDLRAKVKEALWHRFVIGFYSGAMICPVDASAPEDVSADPRLNQLGRLLSDLGLVEDAPQVRLGQMSIRLTGRSSKRRIVGHVREWIERQDHHGWRVFHSGHSIDVVTEDVCKRRVIEHLANRAICDPHTEILRIGDSGDVDGNDFELLEDGLGLSVAAVSIRRDDCWNLLPSGIAGVAGTLFYLQSLEIVDGHLCFARSFIEQAKSALMNAGYRL